MNLEPWSVSTAQADGGIRTHDAFRSTLQVWCLQPLGHVGAQGFFAGHRRYPSLMKSVKAPWRESGAALVCEKCYKTRIPEETPWIAERIGDFALREWLKARCKEAGLGKRVRIVATGCQDICAVGLVTVTILPVGKDGEMETFAVDPLDEREAILSRIMERLA